MTAAQYLETILDLYGEDKTLTIYKMLYGAVPKGETNLAFIQRCSVQDFADREWGGAMFQEIIGDII